MCLGSQGLLFLLELDLVVLLVFLALDKGLNVELCFVFGFQNFSKQKLSPGCFPWLLGLGYCGGLDLQRRASHVDDVQSFHRVLQTVCRGSWLLNALLNLELGLHRIVLLAEVLSLFSAILLEQV